MKKILQSFTQILNGFNHRPNIFLPGDFNIDMPEDNNTLTKDFNQVLAEHCLTNVIMKYTRITATTNHLLNLPLPQTQLSNSKKGRMRLGSSIMSSFTSS